MRGIWRKVKRVENEVRQSGGESAAEGKGLREW
jgi:hypothetical protein